MSKSYIFQKPSGSPFTRLLARGLASLETDKWAMHRRLINPAFHVEKLKVVLGVLLIDHHITSVNKENESLQNDFEQ